MSKKIGREYKMNEENDKNNKQIHIWVDADAIHQSGKWYTNDNIDRMLMERHLNKKARGHPGRII